MGKRDEERHDEKIRERHVQAGKGHVSWDRSNKQDIDSGETARRMANPARREVQRAEDEADEEKED